MIEINLQQFHPHPQLSIFELAKKIHKSKMKGRKYE